MLRMFFDLFLAVVVLGVVAGAYYAYVWWQDRRAEGAHLWFMQEAEVLTALVKELNAAPKQAPAAPWEPASAVEQRARVTTHVTGLVDQVAQRKRELQVEVAEALKAQGYELPKGWQQ